MKIYFNGSDIHRCAIGELESGAYKVFEGGPDTFLQSLNTFIEQCGGHNDQIIEMHVIVGPGSATALRASLSIVNTLRFTQGVDVFGYELLDDSDEEIMRAIQNEERRPVQQGGDLKPYYAHGPRITKSKKNRLKQ